MRQFIMIQNFALYLKSMSLINLVIPEKRLLEIKIMKYYNFGIPNFFFTYAIIRCISFILCRT
ncbi:hypothetical protein D0A34_13750 [Microcoleus vaginatus PCC 9802]|nr:hypothetical protein D0A34_13750 [Microcoleus vaginatus PCC 9802]